MRKSNTGVSVAVAAAFLVAMPMAAFAVVQVNPGWDLLQSGTPTTFGGAPFVGVPLGNFNFGGSVGTQGVGLADTIVHRSSAAVPGAVPGAAPAIPIELLALHLQSAVPVDFGLGVDNYFITLQSERGGPSSTGQMNTSFTDPSGGTFSSFFDVFFDVRKGATNGPIALSSDLVLTNSGTAWNRTPPAGAVTIDGANHLLDGSTTGADFWPIGTFTESHPTGAQHTVTTAQNLPEPAAAGVLLLAFPLMAIRRRAKAIP